MPVPNINDPPPLPLDLGAGASGGGGWLFALAGALADFVNENLESQIATAYQMIGFTSAYFGLSLANLTELGKESIVDYVAKVAVLPENPQAAALAAAEDAEYSIMQQSMNVGLGKLNLMISKGRMSLTQADNAIKHNFEVESPFAALLHLVTAIIGRKPT
jgi:hypothetical protein